VLGLVQGLRARGHEQWLAAPDGPLAGRVAALGVPTRRFAPASDVDFVAAIGLAGHARRMRPQVVHLHSARAHATGFLAARACGAKVVVARRVDFAVGRGPLSALKYRLPVDRFVTVSRGIAGVLERGGIPASKVTVIHSGIDVDAVAQRVDRARTEGRAPALRAALGVPADAPLVGVIAALAPHKDHRTLVLAAQIVLSERPDARFVAAGAGPTGPAVRAQVDGLGLRDSFLLPGFLEDVPALLGALDVFVLSSYLEGLGTSVLDAQAAGVPVVATGVGGVPEMVEDGVNGRLVPPRDPAALAAAILEALADPAKARRRAEQARASVRAFDLAQTIARTEALYRELLA
jgi:glycosyltransferase involved in cell wall biosynthesis